MKHEIRGFAKALQLLQGPTLVGNGIIRNVFLDMT